MKSKPIAKNSLNILEKFRQVRFISGTRIQNSIFFFVLKISLFFVRNFSIMQT